MNKIQDTWLLNYRKNVTSQFGEDGIVEKIFSILPERDMWCVEFGAWDGVFCSNTHNLIKNCGYRSVLIEASTKKIPLLKATYKDNPGQVILNKFIECNSGPNSLDNLLKGTPIPVNFDLLSIDIDGDDYHVWDSLTKFKPKVVIIEFNLTIPSDVEAVQPKGNGNDFGASLLSISKMAKTKGYELVSATDNNGIYVKSEYFSLFNIKNNAPSVMWAPFEKRYTTKIYQKYDSSLVVSGNDKIFWYHVPLESFSS